MMWISRPFGTSFSTLRKNRSTSWWRCRRYVSPVTSPDATSIATNSDVVPWRL